MILLRRWEIGPFLRSFSLRSFDYAPQKIEMGLDFARASLRIPMSDRLFDYCLMAENRR